MNVIGERVSIASSSDPTMVGRAGTVLTETAKTLLIETGHERFIVQKAGQVFVLAGSGKVLLGDEILGRLEDRLGGRKR